MHPNTDDAQAKPADPQDITRRGFLQGSAAAAGGAMLSGLFTQGAHADDDEHDHGPKRATCVAVAASEQGDFVAAFTSDDNGQLIKYVIENDKLLPTTPFRRKHKGKAAYVAVAGNRVLTAGYDGDVIVHDAASDDEKRPTFTLHRKDAPRQVWVAILSNDGKKALSATNDGQIMLWDPTLEVPDNGKVDVFVDKKDFRAAPVGGLAFLSGEKNGPPTHFLSTYSHGDIKLWKIGKTDGPVDTVSHNNSFHVNGLVAANDPAAGTNGRQFVSGGFDGTVRVWGIPDITAINKLPKQEKHKIKAHKNWVWRVALAPDGKLAASASEDGKIGVWNTFSGKQHCPGIEVGKGGSMGVAFGPDGFLYYTLDGSNPAMLLDRKKV